MKERFTSSVRGAWSTLKRDPVAILLPTAGLLLIDVLAAVGVRQFLGSVDMTITTAGISRLVALVAGLELAAFLIGVPLRSLMIASAARALGLGVWGLTRAWSLFFVALAIGLIRGLITAILGVPLALLLLFVAGHGWYGLATLGFAALLLLLGFLRFMVRAVFGYAPILAVADGRGPLAALQEGTAGDDLFGVALAMFVGDCATITGSLCCGAGALPGYPMADLAILHRWHNELPDPEPDPVV